MTTVATRTLVVWCPDWPVVASGKDEDGSTPVAVVASGHVVASSAAARHSGVHRGMRRRQAEATCSGLVVVGADPALEARVFEPVVAAVESLTPRVEIVRPGVCAFPARGPSRYFGGDSQLAERVAATVDAALRPGGSRAGVARCRVGIADGLFAAERAARAGRQIPPGASAEFLARFPVATLAGSDVPGAVELAALLRRLGVGTLGQLAALPAGAVAARFGPAGTIAHRMAGGLDDRPRAARTPPPDLTVATEIDPPAEQVETVAFAARSLAVTLEDELGGRGLALASVRVEAETEHGERLSRVWRLEGGVSAAALAERVRWQLESWLARGGGTTGGLTRLALVPEDVGPGTGRQAGFWGGDRAAGERAARSLARVQGALGPDAVVTAVAVGGRSPAERVRLVPWGDPCTSDEDRPWPGHVPPPSPATVYRPPLPAEVVDRSGARVSVSPRGLVSTEPASLAVDGGPWSDVVAWAGPWPVDERWWDAREHRRRARWQMVTVLGTAHLVTVENGCWVVEAIYD